MEPETRALLGAQLAQLGDHRGEHLLVVHGLEGGLLQRVEPQFLATGQDRVLVSDDDQVHDVAFEQIVGRLDDAVLLAFGQHDGLLIGLGLAQQTVLEGVRRNRGGERGLKRGQNLIRRHMLVEDGGRGLCAGGVGELHGGHGPHRHVAGHGGLDRIGLVVRAAGDEHAEHGGAGLGHNRGAGVHGRLDLLRRAVDGTHGQEHGGGQVGGHIGVEREAVGIIDGGTIGADDHRAARAHAGGLFAGDAGGRCPKQHVGEGLALADRRAEHAGLLGGGQGADDAVGHDVTAVGGFGAEDADGGKTHDVSLFMFQCDHYVHTTTPF